MPDLHESNKTHAFMDAINKYAKQQRDKMQIEAETFKQEELFKVKEEVLKDCQKLVRKETYNIKSKLTREISKEDIKAKRELLLARDAIMKDVLKKAKDKLLKYTKSADYGELLKKQALNIISVLTNDQTKIYIKPGDEKYKNALSEIIGDKCTIAVDESITIGGLRGKNKAKGLIADETLDSKLREQVEWFEENSGLEIV
ncbi:MAG: hypothetical protein Q4B14_01205 [Clostridia bacterium]|nr:hypothetical protein [Clostridia bacterium]